MLLHDSNVYFYNPLDESFGNILNVAWQTWFGNFHYEPSILSSGIQVDDTDGYAQIYSLTNHGTFLGGSGLTVAFWASGFLIGDTLSRTIQIGNAFGSQPLTRRNDLSLFKQGGSSTTFKIASMIAGTNLGTVTITPSPSNDDGWHLFTIDSRRESGAWRFRFSLDGSAWNDLGTISTDKVPGSAGINPMIVISDGNNPSQMITDEAVFWKNSELFSNQQLSNLYELYNTHNITMDQYTSIFGTPINSGINLFIHGSLQQSESVTFYIPGQLEAKSVDFFTHGKEQINNNTSLYITASINIGNDTTLFIESLGFTSDNVPLYIFGQGQSGSIPLLSRGKEHIDNDVDSHIHGQDIISSSGILFTIGGVSTNDSIDNFVHGHALSSGTSTFFIVGTALDSPVFVATVSQNPSNSFHLIIYGSQSGVDNISYVTKNTTLFITSDIDDNFVEDTWPAFVNVDSPLITDYSNTWQSFVCGGNSINNNVEFQITGHAIDDGIHGTPTNNTSNLFIVGRFTKTGDEGLLSTGYSVGISDVSCYAKVHLGVDNMLDFCISGTIPDVNPSGVLNAFIFGITDVTSDSLHVYTLGLQEFNGNNNLFIFGIKDSSSGTMPLYLQVTNIGVINHNHILYTHGF